MCRAHCHRRNTGARSYSKHFEERARSFPAQRLGGSGPHNVREHSGPRGSFSSAGNPRSHRALAARATCAGIRSRTSADARFCRQPPSRFAQPLLQASSIRRPRPLSMAHPDRSPLRPSPCPKRRSTVPPRIPPRPPNKRQQLNPAAAAAAFEFVNRATARFILRSRFVGSKASGQLYLGAFAVEVAIEFVAAVPRSGTGILAVGFRCALCAPVSASTALNPSAFLFARLYLCSSAFICGDFELRSRTITSPRNPLPLLHHQSQKVIQSLRLPIQSCRQRQSISPRRRSSIRSLRQTIAASRRPQRHQQQRRKRQSHAPVPAE